VIGDVQATGAVEASSSSGEVVVVGAPEEKVSVAFVEGCGYLGSECNYDECLLRGIILIGV